MVMCVDEPGIEDEFGRIDNAVGVNLVVSYVIDCVSFDAQVRVEQDAVISIHCHNGFGIFK
jgi:hypothetical protein